MKNEGPGSPRNQALSGEAPQLPLVPSRAAFDRSDACIAKACHDYFVTRRWKQGAATACAPLWCAMLQNGHRKATEGQGVRPCKRTRGRLRGAASLSSARFSRLPVAAAVAVSS